MLKSKFQIIRLNKKGITDFALERNILLESAKSEWVMFLDRDETISQGAKMEIEKEIETGGFSNYKFMRKNYFLGKYVGSDKIIRLVKKGSGKWVRKVHEVWRSNTNSIGTIRTPIIHNTADNLRDYISKINTYSTIHAGENLREKKRSDLFKIIFYPIGKFMTTLIKSKNIVFSIMQALHSFLAWSKQWEAQPKEAAGKLNLSNIFIFLFLVAFPFGQIIRIGIIQPIDVIVGMGALYALVKKLKRPERFGYLENFLLIAAFSWLFSLFLFPQKEVFFGILYLIRLEAYVYFAVYAVNFAKKSTKNVRLLLDSLISISVISSLFGWIQYFRFPSIRPFFVWGWDEHLYRLVGTFLDPTFLGIIIVFGILATLLRISVAKGKVNIFGLAFLTVTLMFTYSRASFLALFAGVLVIALRKKWLGKAVIFILIFAAIVLSLPTKKNTVLNLARTFSAVARVENYNETIKIVTKSPVFGLGYNNLCLARNKFVGYESFSSHACSGSDSSLLFVLAATGIVGLIVLIHGASVLAEGLKTSPHFTLLISTFAALFVHSLFSNSMFYPWVMGWMGILIGIVSGGKRNG